MASLVTRAVSHDDVARYIVLRVDGPDSLVTGHSPHYPGYVEESEAKMHRELETAPYNGRPDLEVLGEPIDPPERRVDGYGALREAAYEYFSSRNGEMGRVPHILLAILVTVSDHRGRGAGSLLVGWGTEKSAQIGLSLYVQASERGRRLYAHHGFKDIGQERYDLKQFGLHGVEVMTEMIR